MKKHRFNELKPPKPIHVIAACVLELVDDPTTPALCAERFIDGADRFGRGFVKHNNNSGFVDHDEHRSTPQAFSAYSFYASEGDVLVCDVQGVDDLYTDPQLHSVDESRGEGDLGRRGMALFFATVDADATRGLFEPLGIPQFELSPAERRRAATQDDEEPEKRSSVRFSGIPDKSTQSRHDEARRLSIMGARRVRLEAQKSVRTLCRCDEINAELEDVSISGGATACAAKALLDAIDESSSSGTPQTSYKLEVAVAEVHAALARLECEARWTANPDVYSALFHCAFPCENQPPVHFGTRSDRLVLYHSKRSHRCDRGPALAFSCLRFSKVPPGPRPSDLAFTGRCGQGAPRRGARGESTSERGGRWTQCGQGVVRPGGPRRRERPSHWPRRLGYCCSRTLRVRGLGGPRGWRRRGGRRICGGRRRRGELRRRGTLVSWQNCFV